MEYNQVFDNQTVYRVLLDCMSRPGTIGDLSEIQKKMDIEMYCYPVTGCIMFTLLDADTTFNAICKDENCIKRMKQLSYCPSVSIEEARNIFVMRDSNEQLSNIISRSHSGTLIDPQLAATIIVEVDEIKEGEQLVLSGCGIKDKAFLQVIPLGNFVKEREIKNQEFPFGVDMIFVDKEGKVVCFPRTTRIEEVSSWPM